MKNPAIKERKIYPIIYPPEGPRSLAIPPVKPVNTGTPTNPSKRYRMQLTVPQSHPLTYTAKNIPRIPKEIGTGLMGIEKERGPKIHIIAVESATLVMVIVVILVFLFIFILPFGLQFQDGSLQYNYPIVNLIIKKVYNRAKTVKKELMEI